MGSGREWAGGFKEGREEEEKETDVETEEDGPKPCNLEKPQEARVLIAGDREQCSGLYAQSKRTAFKYYEYN